MIFPNPPNPKSIWDSGAFWDLDYTGGVVAILWFIFYFFCFILLFLSIYSSCLGATLFCYEAPKNVLWTRKFTQLSFGMGLSIDNNWLLIFGWTITLRHWQGKFSVKWILLYLILKLNCVDDTYILGLFIVVKYCGIDTLTWVKHLNTGDPDVAARVYRVW